MICYHHNDLDGRMSAAIVKYRYPKCRMYEIDHGYIFPWNGIKNDEQILMVDFTLDPFGDMLRLARETNLIWIDHHKSAIDAWKDSGSPPIVGTRVIGVAACILTWKYLFPNMLTPTSVILAGKYDVWDHDTLDVLRFQYGMMTENCDPENQKMWKWLFEDITTHVYIGRGHVIKEYIQQTDAEICKAQAFETMFKEHLCLAVNRLFVSSYFFKSIKNYVDYDILIMFGWQEGTWKVSLRSEKVNLVEIVEKYGGGGHVGAAGFECSKLPFDLTNLMTVR